MTELSREEVIRIAKESGFRFHESNDRFIVLDHEIERFAAAIHESAYAKGAEDMRERAAQVCSNNTSLMCSSTAIRALPITPTNTEEELDPANCEYCGGNDETPAGHCMDCARPNQQHHPVEWGPSNRKRLTCSCGHPDPAHYKDKTEGEQG